MTYTEDAPVEQPAIKLFNELGWDTLNCWDEDFGEESLLGRENRGDVVLINRLRPALVKLNPDSPELAIELKGTEAEGTPRILKLPVIARKHLKTSVFKC